MHSLKTASPTLPNNAATKCLIIETIRLLCQIEKSRDIVLEHMRELACMLPEYPVVLAMSGVGTTLASRLIAEIGDIRRFYSKDSLIAYAGIDTPPRQSGSFTATKTNISKRGNRHLRKVGYEVMQSVIRVKPTTDTAVYDFIIKKQDEGKSKKAAKIAGLNKFLKIYYARVKEVCDSIDVMS